MKRNLSLSEETEERELSPVLHAPRCESHLSHTENGSEIVKSNPLLDLSSTTLSSSIQNNNNGEPMKSDWSLLFERDLSPILSTPRIKRRRSRTEKRAEKMKRDPLLDLSSTTLSSSIQNNNNGEPMKSDWSLLFERDLSPILSTPRIKRRRSRTEKRAEKMQRDPLLDLSSTTLGSSIQNNNNGEPMKSDWSLLFERDLSPILSTPRIKRRRSRTEKRAEKMKRDPLLDLSSTTLRSCIQTKSDVCLPIKETEERDLSLILHTRRRKLHRSLSESSAQERKRYWSPSSTTNEKAVQTGSTTKISRSVQTDAKDAQPDNRLKVLHKHVEGQNYINLFYDIEPSPSGDLSQESMAIDGTSVSETNENTELFETFTSDSLHQPEMGVSWNVEDSPMDPEDKIISSNSQGFHIEPPPSPSGDFCRELFSIDKTSVTDASDLTELLEMLPSNIRQLSPTSPDYNITPTNSQEITENNNNSLHIETISSQVDNSPSKENEEYCLSIIDPLPSQEMQQKVQACKQDEETGLSIIDPVISQEDVEVNMYEIQEFDEDKETGLSNIDPVNSQEDVEVHKVNMFEVESRSTPIEDSDEINSPSSEEDTSVSPIKIRRMKLEDYDASKFRSLANRCKSQRIIWEYQLRSSQFAMPPSDWPVFIVKELISRFNCILMKCARDGIERERYSNASLPESFNILCHNDLSSNMRKPGVKFKIHLPLFIFEHKNEVYLLGGNRLESVESQLSSIEKPEELLNQSFDSDEEEMENGSNSDEEEMENGSNSDEEEMENGSNSDDDSNDSMSDESSTDGRFEDIFDDCDQEISMQNVLKVRDVLEFNIYEAKGLIRLGNLIRFFVSNPLIIGIFVGWAVLPFTIQHPTRARGHFMLVLKDSAQHICALALSKEDFTKWKSMCQNDDAMTNRKYKVTGFKFTHILPIQMIPPLTNYRPEETLEYKTSVVYFISPNSPSQFCFERID